MARIEGRCDGIVVAPAAFVVRLPKGTSKEVVGAVLAQLRRVFLAEGASPAIELAAEAGIETPLDRKVRRVENRCPRARL